ncbi:hypothetical protein BJ138DRAFT_1147728 [Hygrophoropsis aurantiaca]|uniref:Uncharacterized protein n=1 Tax=Hygrophoropsis aurantiaca TaxID=72124 RepID=A0ACB8AHR8_9AGAM|nr:hypothetical protein BJ138DRAFT_1147728 [Hygrophoropsis aurantiaca]
MLLSASFTKAGKTHRKNRSMSSTRLNEVSRIKFQTIFKSLRVHRKAGRSISGESRGSPSDNRQRRAFKRPLLSRNHYKSYIPISSPISFPDCPNATTLEVIQPHAKASSAQEAFEAHQISCGTGHVLPSCPSVFALRADPTGDYLVAQLGRNLERMSLSDEETRSTSSNVALASITSDKTMMDIKQPTSVGMMDDCDIIYSPQTQYTWLDAPTIIITSADSCSNYSFPPLRRSSARLANLTNFAAECSDDPFTFEQAASDFAFSYSLPPFPSPLEFSSASLDWDLPDTPSPCYDDPQELTLAPLQPLGSLLNDTFQFPQFSFPTLEAGLFVSSSA